LISNTTRRRAAQSDANPSLFSSMNAASNYLLNPLLSDLDGHIAMMDRAGIDAGVLSWAGLISPMLACRQINDCMRG
jgi:hypothetical protein